MVDTRRQDVAMRRALRTLEKRRAKLADERKAFEEEVRRALTWVAEADAKLLRPDIETDMLQTWWAICKLSRAVCDMQLALDSLSSKVELVRDSWTALTLGDAIDSE
jgi:hypothetical protein